MKYNILKFFGLSLLGMFMINKLNISMTILDHLILSSGLLFVSFDRIKEDE